MSATLDAASFVNYFTGARPIHVQGRQFPVQVVHAQKPVDVGAGRNLHSAGDVSDKFVTPQVMYTRKPMDDYMDAALTAILQVVSSLFGLWKALPVDH